MDWLSEHLPEDSSIRIESLTETHTILALAGPKSCDLLQQVAPNDDWSKEGFPWLNVRKIHIGSHTIIALSVSFSGELAWELHVPNSSLEDTYHTLVAAGEAFGLAHFGLYAAESMRLEKGYRHWKADLITEFNPIESGLERFVNWNKQFHGKSGLQDQVRNGIRKLFVSMVLDGVHAPALPGDSILANGKVIGTVTSAGWGHRVNRNLAMGFIDPAFAETGTQVQLEVIGDPVTATVCEACQYDQESRLVRR
jgi:dimethylglycine dehydrogenase